MGRFASTVSLWLLAVAACLAQQREVEGGVSDGGGAPIPFATIAVSADSAGKSVAGFAVTDAEGKFKLKIRDASRPWWLTARSVGFRTVRREFNFAETLFVRIRMEEDNKSLDDVVVRGVEYGVKVGNDTVRFNPSVFKTGEEQNLADVIKKLPGVAVQDDGSMTFRGKKVDKFLVDGKEALSGGGSTKTLPPDFAESIEMLENYSDGNVADAFSTRRQTAMNIKTDGSRKTALYVSAAGGVENRFDVRSSAFQLGKRLSLSATFNANNTGEAVFSVMDYINSTGGISGVSEDAAKGNALKMSQEEQAVLSAGTDEVGRTSGVVSANVAFDGLKGYSVNLSLVGHALGAEANRESGLTFHLPAADVSTSVASANDKESRLVAGFLTQKLDRGGRLSLRAKTKFLWGRNDDSADYDERRDGQFYDHADDKWVRSAGVSQTLSLSVRAGETLVYADAEGSFRHADTRTWVTALRDLPNIFARNGGMRQSRESEEFGGGVSAGAVVPLFLGVGLKGEVGFNARRCDLSSDDGQPSESLTNVDGGLYAGLTKSKGLWRFDAGAHLALYGRRTDMAGLGSGRKTTVEPSLRSSWAFSKASNLSVSATWRVGQYDMNTLSRKAVLLGYEELRLPSAVTGAGSRSLNATLNYTLFSQFSRTMLFAVATYSRTADAALADYSTDSRVSTQAFARSDGEAQAATLMLYVDKGVASLPLEVRLQADANASDADVSRAGQTGSLSVRGLRSSLRFRSRFRRSPVNAAISGSYAYAGNEVSSMSIKTSSDTWGADLRLLFNRRAFAASLTGKWDKTVSGGESVVERDVDFEATYKWRRFTFKVAGRDVVHLDAREWLSESSNPNQSVTARYGRMPGYIVAGLAFNK